MKKHSKMVKNKKTECTYPGCTAATEIRKIVKSGVDPSKYLCRKHKSKATSGQDSRSKSKSDKQPQPRRVGYTVSSRELMPVPVHNRASTRTKFYPRNAGFTKVTTFLFACTPLM